MGEGGKTRSIGEGLHSAMAQFIECASNQTRMQHMQCIYLVLHAPLALYAPLALTIHHCSYSVACMAAFTHTSITSHKPVEATMKYIEHNQKSTHTLTIYAIII